MILRTASPRPDKEKITSANNKAIVSRFFELLEERQSLPEDMLGPGFSYHVAETPPLDLEGARSRMAAFGSAFSDIRHALQDMVAEGDRVAFRSRLEMTHTGEFRGVAGSGEQVTIVEMGFVRIANGKIAEMWGLLDTLGLMRQIGAIP